MQLPAKFENVEPLSPGQNALVFRATNALLNRVVFLKIYALPSDDPLSALREPRLLQTLNHDHLAKIYGADTIDADERSHICLEMELVRGGSLKDLIDAAQSSGEWLNVHDAIRLVADAAAGLGHLHDNGFVHRDVKPANIMARDRGKRRSGVITDLGLASRLNASGRAFASRHARVYRPPEVWNGMGYTVKSDIYQLGIVLFQVLGGDVAYDLGKLDDPALATAISTGRFMVWDSLPPHISRPLQSVIKTATAADDRERYGSMSHFCVALNNVCAKQHNWAYVRESDGGFLLRRPDGAKELKLVVRRTAPNLFEVQRFKSASAAFRRIGKAEYFQHPNLSHCQDFLAVLRESW
ncbi:serine/threonine-protein kinase [Sorangium sp. So ce117]|uniref:serine/threonine-protein kinase n=1 Tax=Sorangium sp. So ce117 TaxID=3133277 RepID=UPI003F630F30